jgi:hypothetical protein
MSKNKVKITKEIIELLEKEADEFYDYVLENPDLFYNPEDDVIKLDKVEILPKSPEYYKKHSAYRAFVEYLKKKYLSGF